MNGKKSEPSGQQELSNGRSQFSGSLVELRGYVFPLIVHAVVVLAVLLMLQVVEMVRHPLQASAPQESAWGILGKIDIYTATIVVFFFCAYLVVQLGMLLVSGTKQTWCELFVSDGGGNESSAEKEGALQHVDSSSEPVDRDPVTVATLDDNSMQAPTVYAPYLANPGISTAAAGRAS